MDSRRRGEFLAEIVKNEQIYIKKLRNIDVKAGIKERCRAGHLFTF